MIIYLDFRGTIVDPAINRPNFGYAELIRDLQRSGHDIIMNTSEDDKSGLERMLKMVGEDAWMFVESRERDTFRIIPIIDRAPRKIAPAPWNLDEAIERDTLFIDDLSTGIPLKPSFDRSAGVVDMTEVKKQLLEKGIIRFNREHIMERQNFLSVDGLTARSSLGEFFYVGEVVGNQDKEVGFAKIKRFEMDVAKNEIKAHTSRGHAHLDFLEKL